MIAHTMHSNHAIACGCAICTPFPVPAPSPIMQSARPTGSDIESAQVVALFEQLDDRGKAMVFAMLQAAARLCRGRG